MSPVTDVFTDIAGIFPFFFSVGETVGAFAVVVSIVPIAINKRTAAGIAEVYVKHFEEFSEKRSVSVIAFLYERIERCIFRDCNSDSDKKFVERCSNDWILAPNNVRDKIRHVVDIFRGVTVVHITVVHIKPPGFFKNIVAEKLQREKRQEFLAIKMPIAWFAEKNCKSCYNCRHG